MTTFQHIFMFIGFGSYFLAMICSYFVITQKKEAFSQCVRWFAFLACILHLYMLLDIGVHHRSFPISNMLQSSFFFSSILMLVVLVIDILVTGPLITCIAIPLIFAHLVIASTLLSMSYTEQYDGSIGLVIAVHVMLMMVSYALFAFSFITGALYLIEQRSIRSSPMLILNRLFPSIESLYKMTLRSYQIGFLLLTIGLLTGYAMGREIYTDNNDWRTDPKTLLTALTWFAYFTVILLGRLHYFRGRKIVTLSVCSFSFIIATFWITVFIQDFHDFL